MKEANIIYQVFEGPSLYASDKVIVVTYDDFYFGQETSVSPIELMKLELLNLTNLKESLRQCAVNNVHQLFEFLINYFITQYHYQPLSISVANNLPDNKKQIKVAFLHAPSVILLVKASINIVMFIKSPLTKPSNHLLNSLNTIPKRIEAINPNRLGQEILYAAKQKRVPSYFITYNAATFLCGQGNQALMLNNSCTEFDSNIGFNLQKDKSKANYLINLLGFPATEQRIVNSLDAAQKVAAEFGFPLVIKPIDEGRGMGVTANIVHFEHIAPAYQKAAQVSNNHRVLVEKFVVGDDHRITVSQGKISGISRRRAASVLGNGLATIQELIHQENKNREGNIDNQTTLKSITVDADLNTMLAQQKLSLQSIPKPGERIYLRSNANLSTGGELTVIDEQKVHADNLQMAIEIAKAFRLDSVGLDFITPDIALSWQQAGAVVELNAYPMLSERLAKKLVDNYFPEPHQGRIPSTLLLSNNNTFFETMLNNKEYYKAQDNLVLGFVSSECIYLNNIPRKNVGASLYKRCLTLVTNTCCESMVVAMSPQEIITQGLPIDYFDMCLLDENINLSDERMSATIKHISGKESLVAWLKNYVGELLIKSV